MKSNLIVPIAFDKEEYENIIPFVFRIGETGVMYCIQSILGIEYSKFANIYFTVLLKHSVRYGVRKMLELQFEQLQILNAKVVELEENTESQPETVYCTIKKENIEGSIYIKDADNYFKCSCFRGNNVVIYPLESLTMVNPQNKSYVAVDEMGYITNIIEKKVIGNYFCVGGYSFDNVKDFCRYYETLREYSGGLYISHIVYSMLLDKFNFRPLFAKEYLDFDNL